MEARARRGADRPLGFRDPRLSEAGRYDRMSAQRPIIALMFCQAPRCSASAFADCRKLGDASWATVQLDGARFGAHGDANGRTWREIER
jgi:hypothetical protein